MNMGIGLVLTMAACSTEDRAKLFTQFPLGHYDEPKDICKSFVQFHSGFLAALCNTPLYFDTLCSLGTSYVQVAAKASDAR